MRPLPPEFSLDMLLRHGLVNVAFCCLVATGLALTTAKPWDQQLVYSLAIGMTIWLCVDVGRFAVRGRSDNEWPTGIRGVSLVLFSIVTGFVVGTTVGDWYCGCSTWGQMAVGSNRLVTSMIITLCAGVAGSYFFHSRGRQKAQQALIALAERDATEARLRLLQAQLEPHMLFNTLANLRVLIGLDPAQATRMLDHLVAFLRATLIASRATEHSLAHEFDRLRDYLELMAVRMGPRLQYELHLPAELADWPVPTLLLQPLVENSIQHGLEPQVAGGVVRVSASVVPGRGLLLEVVDTGQGFDSGAAFANGSGAGTSAPLAGATTGRAGTGFGVAQIRERLATGFGERATLSFKANAGGGTAASIVLPLR